MRNLIILGASVAALAVPTVAMAAAPTGDYNGTLKGEPNANFIQNDHRSLVGEYSARSIQNGQFISGRDPDRGHVCVERDPDEERQQAPG
jgi:hypothetical protein